MIKLDKITKVYVTEERKTEVLKRITVCMRQSEFVCILGHSGCGKTTLLNIIGGLDRYTSGDLSVDGKSTKDFTDEDWDTYRSRKVGFVFQSYNLIPHQTVIENVETALTISGVGREERRKRAIDALVKVGLSEHLRKKPSQLSGGEMQRVAIARAIVNDPETILADEPTGALDSKNSELIMDLLKEISKDRLVITVTHNDELAKKYATRTIKMRDGEIESDSNPYNGKNANKAIADGEKPETKKKHSFMSYGLAARLSFKNLVNKKVRTLLTSAAAAVAVLGISLVVACTNGLNTFVNKVQKDSMSSFPVTVSNNYLNDLSLYINQFLGSYENGGITSSSITSGGVTVGTDKGSKKGSVLLNRTLKEATENASATKKAIDKDYVDYINGNIDPARVSIVMERQVSKKVYKSVELPYKNISLDGKPVNKYYNFLVNTADQWTCLPNGNIVGEQYEVVAGKYPENYNELALVVDKNSSITDSMMVAFFIDVEASIRSDDDKNVTEGYSYEDIFNKYGKFNLVLNDDYYVKNGENEFIEKSISFREYLNKLCNKLEEGKTWESEEYDKKTDAWYAERGEKTLKNYVGESLAGSLRLYNALDERNIKGNSQSNIKSTELKITCVLKLKDDVQYGMLSTPICYTEKLNDYIIENSAASEVVIAQKNNGSANVTYRYSYNSDGSKTKTQNAFTNLTATLGTQGYAELPTKIKFYPNKIEDNDYLIGVLDKYNLKADGTKKDVSEQIRYVDNVSAVMSLVRLVLGSVSGVLIALTAVSLVVSAIMIGIITYVSVIERVKEIGVLRAVGARKKDIVRLFVTETGIIGLLSGVMGLLVTFIAEIPLNAILKSVTGIGSLVFLNWWHILVLIGISVFITIAAGFIPSLMASKQDPVKALRSE